MAAPETCGSARSARFHACLPQDLRAVLFDVDGTLYRQQPLRLRMALELATDAARSILKRGPAAWRILRAYRRAGEELRALGRGDRPIGRLRLARASESSGASPEHVERVVEEWFEHRPLRHLRGCLREGLVSLLDTLARRGVRAGVLSDLPPLGKLRALGLEGRFAPALAATDPEINAYKPHPRGFQHACECWGLAPEQVLYVGDRPEVDAVGAAAAGIRAAIVGNGGRPAREVHAAIFVSSFDALEREIDSHD